MYLLFSSLFGISLLALLFALLKPNIMLRNPIATRKKAAIVYGAITFLFLILAGSTAPPSKPQVGSEKQSNPTPTRAPETPTEKPTPVLTATPKPTPTPSKINQLNTAITIALGKNAKFEAKYEDDIKLATVTLPEETFWDETAVVRGTFSTLVKIGIDIFKIEGIEALSVIRMGKFTDQYGKEGIEKATQFTMEKKEFQKYDWNNLKYTNIYNQMINSTTLHYIHPALMKKLNTDKLYLAL